MSPSYELAAVDSAPSYGGTFAGISGSRHRQRDESTLARLGKKQVLKVREAWQEPSRSMTDMQADRSLCSGALDFYLSSDSVAQFWLLWRQH